MTKKTIDLLRRYGKQFKAPPLRVLVPLLLFVTVLVTWQIAFAQAPSPNPLAPVIAGGNQTFAPVPGVDITQNGQAASIHGDPHRGQLLFAQNCTTCHGDRGTDGIPNPGSDDGSVPLLNPIDSGFIEGATESGDDLASGFAKGIDLFIQHGSRPSGDDPLYSMIGWGDHKLLNQQQIADLEAYVMQLNGLYWPDRFYPPSTVQMTATREGNFITYTIWLINQGSSPLGDITLRDTLPANLIPIKAAILGFDQRVDVTDPGDQGNNGQIIANTVQFVGTPNVPPGGKLGPFTILARIANPQQPVTPNVAQLLFSFQTFDGNNYMSSAVSDPVTPTAPKTATATSVVPSASTTPTLSRAATTPPATTAAATAASTSAAVTGTVAATAAATRTAAPASSASSTPSAASGQVGKTFAAQIVEPNPGALSWGYDPSTITIQVGDKVTWTNAGSMGHSVTADDGSFDSGVLNSGENWTYTFTKAGTYTYHCTPHPWMKGTVVVQ